MSVKFDDLPLAVRLGCGALRDELVALLGGNLVALWVYGAVVFEGHAFRSGDVDTHGVVREVLPRETCKAIEEVHDSTSRDFGLEWDSWYVLERDMGGRRPPAHALRERLIDHAWALHRAHWLAGQYVGLHGREPIDLVQPPAWAELEEALRSEFLFIERIVEKGRREAAEAAFVVWNGCRILYSLETRDVVVSKRAAARWALDHLPKSWRAAIRAAGHVYDGTPDTGEESALEAAMLPIVAALRSSCSGRTGSPL
jgi:hypothetical protein